MTFARKLIEVSLPLETIKDACVDEKFIRTGHPANLHQWWSRKPLVAAHAVLFASLVDDPSEYLDNDLPYFGRARTAFPNSGTTCSLGE